MATAATEYVNTLPEQALLFPLILAGVLGAEILKDRLLLELFEHAAFARTIILPALQEVPNNT